MNYIKPFSEIRITDVALVGGKTASLGEMIFALGPLGIKIPDGFAITATGYWHYIDHNNLREQIAKEMERLHDTNDFELVQKVGNQIRRLISNGAMPEDMHKEIGDAYKKLSAFYSTPDCAVAVRSSATAEDLPGLHLPARKKHF